MTISLDPRISIKADNLSFLREQLALQKDVDLAAAMGVHQSTVSRVLSGKSQPGSRFIAALCGVFKVRFDVLFEVVYDYDVSLEASWVQCGDGQCKFCAESWPCSIFEGGER